MSEGFIRDDTYGVIPDWYRDNYPVEVGRFALMRVDFKNERKRLVRGHVL